MYLKLKLLNNNNNLPKKFDKKTIIKIKFYVKSKFEFTW